MLKNEKLRMEIIQLYHNIPVARHEGRQKTIQLVMRNYQQPRITKYIRKYIDGYNMCLRMKNHTKILVEKLMANKISERPQTYLIVDFITKLPLVARKDTILVVCCQSCKYWTLFHFYFSYFLFILSSFLFLFYLELGFSIMSQSHNHMVIREQSRSFWNDNII